MILGYSSYPVWSLAWLARHVAAHIPGGGVKGQQRLFVYLCDAATPLGLCLGASVDAHVAVITQPRQRLDDPVALDLRDDRPDGRRSWALWAVLADHVGEARGRHA